MFSFLTMEEGIKQSLREGRYLFGRCDNQVDDLDRKGGSEGWELVEKEKTREKWKKKNKVTKRLI